MRGLAFVLFFIIGVFTFLFIIGVITSALVGDNEKDRCNKMHGDYIRSYNSQPEYICVARLQRLEINMKP